MHSRPLLCLILLTMVSPAAAAPLPAQQAATQPAEKPQAVSLLGRPLYPMQLSPDVQAKHEEQLAEAREAYEADPTSEELIIWLGRRLAYLGRYRDAIAVFTEGLEHHPESFRLLRHRGHRYITLRRFDDAIADLRRAADLVEGVDDEVEPDGQPNPRGIPRSTTQGNIFYHLGLAHYLRGDYERALDAYQRCLKLSRNDDMRCATGYWLYLTLRRLDRKAEADDLLRHFQSDMDVIENQAYHQLLLFYKGERALEDLAGQSALGSIDDATFKYGLAMWYLLNRPAQKWEAIATLRSIVDGPAWPAFGHIAAEAELTRLKDADEEQGSATDEPQS